MNKQEKADKTVVDAVACPLCHAPPGRSCLSICCEPGVACRRPHVLRRQVAKAALAEAPQPQRRAGWG